MSATTPTETSRRTRTGVSRAVGLPIAVMLLLAFLLLSSLTSESQADTVTTHTVTASVGSQTDVAPAGPLTSLADASVVTIRVTQASAGDPITSIKAIRQCEPDAVIANDGDLGPSNTGFCLDEPLSAGSDNVKVNLVKANGPADTFIETTFKVGMGTREVHFDAGNGDEVNAITCDDTHNCSLWIEIGRTGGNDFVHYDLDFGAATTTTAAPTTTTTAAPTTTTTAPGGTSTTTTAVGATSSTTSTTLPAGTTVTPSAAPGGNLTVSSTGWGANAVVTGTLNSTPVILGTLTADATGKVAGSFTVPATTPVGVHTLVLTGTGATGSARTINAGVTIGAATTSSSTGSSTTLAGTSTTVRSGGSGLPNTGANVAKVFVSALLVAFAGWLLLVSAVHRRDRLGSAR